MKCKVYQDKTKSRLIIEVPMAENKMFPISIDHDLKHALTVTLSNDSLLWHHRYGHLGFKNLELLSKQNMVNGLPQIIRDDHICESCVLGKHHRDAFPKGKAWRASKPLE